MRGCHQTLNNDPLSRFAAQLQLATAALPGELTHVVFMGSGTGSNFDMQDPTANPAANKSRKAAEQSQYPGSQLLQVVISRLL